MDVMDVMNVMNVMGVMVVLDVLRADIARERSRPFLDEVGAGLVFAYNVTRSKAATIQTSLWATNTILALGSFGEVGTSLTHGIFKMVYCPEQQLEWTANRL
eukprot:gnl/MRDRNA2_/MRDRNA2_80387_c0_seq2.p1 gnl/MRDRNA2_/MRDRNA2_80387_c0~~gnl/MRDRNA2_/MRDRNA2_80387_c0_seq2.p1  ORF type:complete len:102 (+),score=12.37 gnl/MRDRNA2_/MRDRNA2_80387_c0_seq2:3-308(+)